MYRTSLLREISRTKSLSAIANCHGGRASHYQQASFWRGGTSNGLMIAGLHLPEWQYIRSRYDDISNLDLYECANILQPLFRAAMGSPDPYGRQLNGMGGGLSSLSKAVIVDKSSDPDADLDYLFVQIGIKDGKLDLAGNCGNMSSAVAPFGLDESIVQASGLSLAQKHQITSSRTLSLRLRNLNTKRYIKSTFSVYQDTLRYREQGDYKMSGVPGSSSPITLSFFSPTGSKTGKAFPTGNKIDYVTLPTGQIIQATLSDISNPGVFIDGSPLHSPSATPAQLSENTDLLSTLEHIRCSGAKMMGLDSGIQSIPKVVMIFPPINDKVDISCQALSMQQPHRAVPMTLALNLGVACNIEGTLMSTMARRSERRGKVVVGHPSGSVEVGAEFDGDRVVAAGIIRTARCLMRGEVNIDSEEVSAHQSQGKT